MPSHQQIEIRSEEVQEILAAVPNWLIRWGITLIFTILIVLLLASWFVKYPDTITAKIIVTTQTPPVSLIARSQGKINLLIKDQQLVKAGDHLGVLENPARTEDIFKLLVLADTYSNYLRTPEHFPSSLTLETKEDLKLGELQLAYQAFLESLRNYHFFIEYGALPKQINSINARINSYNLLNRQLSRQLKIMEKELALNLTRFKTDSLLFTEKVLAEMDLNKSKSSYLQAESSFENMKSNLINTTLQITELEAQIVELSIQQAERKAKLGNDIVHTFEQLEHQLESWKQKYLMEAPMDGKVSFSKYWSDNQFVNLGDEVLTIVPDSGEIVGQVFLPVAGSGKVETGQRVNIRFDSYPSNEYGMVAGTIKQISLLPIENVYMAYVTLPNGLNTSYKKELAFKQEMLGSAEVITEDLRLLERIFNQLRALVDTNI